MATKLTVKWLDAQVGKPREKRVNVTDESTGLGVRLTLTGKVVFQWRYRWGGKQRVIDLGEYPATGLADAKKKLLQWQAVLDDGRDPVTVQRLAKVAELTAQTNEQVIRDWFDRYLVKNRKHSDPIIRRFEKHVFPHIGALPAKDTERRHWLTVFERLVDDEKFGLVDKLLADSKQALAWAENREAINRNPLATLTLRMLGVVRQQGDRTLTDDELYDVWHRMEETGHSRKNQLMIQLLLLFACRTIELRLAEKAHFDLEAGIWTVPADLTKSLKRPVKRPIIPEARMMLEELFALSPESKLLIPKQDGQPMTHSAPVQSQTKLRKHFGHADWTLHDLRRTARTAFSAIIQPHVAEKMLGHKLGGVMAIYDKHDYLDEQRRAYSQWVTQLNALKASKKVVMFKARC
jgi:integrase